MSEENKETNLPEEENSVPTPEETTGDNWDWDAAVPETSVDNITFDDLGVDTTQPEPIEEPVVEEPVIEEPVPEENTEIDNDHCIVCGKLRKDSPSELYCNECREKFLRTNYGVGHIILAFVMVIVAAIGYFVCVPTVKEAVKVFSIESAINDKKYDEALDLCTEMDSDISTINSSLNAVALSINNNFTNKTWFSLGNRVSLLHADVLTDTAAMDSSGFQNYTSAIEAIFVNSNNKFDEALLEKNGSEKVKNLYKFCTEFEQASSKFSVQDYVSYNEDSTLNVKYDEMLAFLDKQNASTPAEKSIVNYFKFMAAYYAKKDNKTIFDFLDKTCECAGEYSYVFWDSYMGIASELSENDRIISIAEKAIARNANDTDAYYYLIQANIHEGKLAEADKACETMKQNNPDGLDYYGLKATILRRQSKFDEALKICTEGIALGENAEIYRQQAIVYMLQGKKDKAKESGKQAYDIELQNAYSGSSYVSLETLNTGALIAYLCGDDDTYNEAKDLFDSEGMTFMDSVLNCIKGEITFEQIFMEGTGDVE